jgi:hypothetical protein
MTIIIKLLPTNYVIYAYNDSYLLLNKDKLEVKLEYNYVK